MATNSMTGIGSSFELPGGIMNSFTNQVNAYKSVDQAGTTYAEAVTKTKTTGTAQAILNFYGPEVFSALPDDAVINRVVFRTRCCVNATNVFGYAWLQAVRESSKIGSTTDFLTATPTTYTILDQQDGWTVSQLKGGYLRILYEVYRNNNKNNAATVRIYGADVTVTYTVEGQQQELNVKLNNAWVPVQKAYKKTGGVWVEQTDLSAVFESGKNYSKK